MRRVRAAAVALVLVAGAWAGDVAVLVEPGMVRYGGMPALPSSRIAPLLGECGIEAEGIDARQASDPKQLNARRYAVLVMPYGNAFPLPAFDNLRAFHRGGCLVLNGVPFCHPCERVEDKGKRGWRDLGHKLYFGHDARGVGTGGFGGPAAAAGRLSVTAGNPLGLSADVLPRPAARLQWLDASKLDPRDEVLPLVELRGADGKTRRVAALVRHRCEQFPRACDVWLGQVASEMTPADRYAAEQLVVRGTAWCLHEKGKLSRKGFDAVLARLDRRPRPEPLPDQLEAATTPRPWGTTFFPKSKPPANELLAVDVRKLSRAERLALVCLQGLTSRKQPILWLVFTPWDERWLDWHQKKGHVYAHRKVADWRAPFKQFAASYRGAVVPDDKLYRGSLLACNLAAVEDCIVAPEPLAEKLGLEVRHDLRGRFATYAEGLRWLWATHGDRLNHHLCTVIHPDLAWVLGYDIQWRSVIFWVAGERDGERAGADPMAERSAMAAIFSQMPANVGMRGFPAHGKGLGMGEGGGVEFCGGYGKALVCTNLTPNVSVMSGVRIDALTPRKPPPAPPLDRGKIYIALAMSDGDNLNTLYHYFPRYFEHAAHGEFPVAWGMGPAALDLMPAVVQWYYERAAPTDEFLADVSGIAYVFPQTYAHRFRDRGRILDGFTAWTSRYMQRLGMQTLRPHGGDRAAMARLARGLPFVHSIFADYARRGGTTYAQSVYTVAGGTPVFHALTHWRYGKDGLLRDVREQVGRQRPAFVNAFLHNWTFDMDSLHRAVRNRDRDMAFVTPAQLAALYRQAIGK